MLLKPFVAVGSTRPACEVADVFREYGAAYQREHPVTWQQHKVMRDIVQCRTAVLGGYVEQCLDCGRLRISYVPCDNRHCPKCGAFEKAQWLAARRASLLPIHYFHVVFTTDHAVNPLVRANQKVIYDLLFRAATANCAAHPSHSAYYCGCHPYFTTLQIVLQKATPSSLTQRTQRRHLH